MNHGTTLLTKKFMGVFVAIVLLTGCSHGSALFKRTPATNDAKASPGADPLVTDIQASVQRLANSVPLPGTLLSDLSAIYKSKCPANIPNANGIGNHSSPRCYIT